MEKVTRRGIHAFIGRAASHPRFSTAGIGDKLVKNRLFLGGNVQSLAGQTVAL